jgi:hypothetical protein
MWEEDEHRFNRGWLLNAGIAAARLTDGGAARRFPSFLTVSP